MVGWSAWGSPALQFRRCGIGSGVAILFGLFGIALIGVTVYVIASVIPAHWRQRRWAFLVVDVLLIIGAGLIALRPLGQAWDELVR